MDYGVKEKGGRPLRNCPVGNFREEPDCRGGLGERQKAKGKRQKVKGEREIQ